MNITISGKRGEGKTAISVLLILILKLMGFKVKTEESPWRKSGAIRALKLRSKISIVIKEAV